MADVDQTLDGLDLSVAVLDCCASRWLCAAGIRFTALSGMVITCAPVSMMALTLRCFRMAACIACCLLPIRSESVVALCVRSSDLNTGVVVPLHSFASMVGLMLAGACNER